MELRERTDRAEVEVLAEDEGANERAHAQGVLLEGGGRLVDRPVADAALQPSEALPVAPLRVEVLLQHVGRAHDRARVPIRAQPHVDAEDEAGALDVVQAVDHAAREPLEEFLRGERAAGVGGVGRHARLTLGPVEEDEVDVGADVQLPSAQLPHPDHHQVHRVPFGVAGDAVARGELPGVGPHHRVDRDFREVAHHADDFLVVPRPDASRTANPATSSRRIIRSFIPRAVVSVRPRGRPPEPPASNGRGRPPEHLARASPRPRAPPPGARARRRASARARLRGGVFGGE